MLLQLWHVGRISDPIYLGGDLPVAPSAIAAKGHVSQIRPQKPFVTPRALAIEEIAGVIEAFRQGQPRTPRPRALTASRSMARTAIFSTSFCKTARTGAPIPMAARSKTGHA